MSQSPIIPRDLFCSHCKYNLKMLDPSGLCPECGNPIDDTLLTLRPGRAKAPYPSPEQIRLRVVELAQRKFDARRSTFEKPPSERRASLDEFPAIDRRFYEETLDLFLSEGFVYIGDYENLNVTNANPDLRHPMRRCVGDDAAIRASFWHLQAIGELRQKQRMRNSNRTNVRMICLNTHFQDGSEIETTNFKSHLPADLPLCRGDVRQGFSLGTSAMQLLKLHRRRVELELADKSNHKAVPTPDEAAVALRHAQYFRRMLKHVREFGFFDFDRLDLTPYRHWSGSTRRIVVEALMEAQKKYLADVLESDSAASRQTQTQRQ